MLTRGYPGKSIQKHLVFCRGRISTGDVCLTIESIGLPDDGGFPLLVRGADEYYMGHPHEEPIFHDPWDSVEVPFQGFRILYPGKPHIYEHIPLIRNYRAVLFHTHPQHRFATHPLQFFHHRLNREWQHFYWNGELLAQSFH
jgi:hypothetical protein